MRAVLQRVTAGSVLVAGEISGQIGPGLLILLGVAKGDSRQDAAYLAKKIAKMRIFANESGHFDRSLLDVGGSALVVSQFTLYADCSRGLRPSFDQAAPAEEAKELYLCFAQLLAVEGVPVQTGVFGADMQVNMAGDGPVTILIDSK
jgi:D-tyrosyl-tRNA(Tyr) deacylase